MIFGSDEMNDTGLPNSMEKIDNSKIYIEIQLKEKCLQVFVHPAGLWCSLKDIQNFVADKEEESKVVILKLMVVHLMDLIKNGMSIISYPIVKIKIFNLGAMFVL